MRSSAVNLVRAAVMLGALVAIPLIAVFGRNLPGEIIELIDSHLAAPSAAASQALPPAPVFSPDLAVPAPDRPRQTGPAGATQPPPAAMPTLGPKPASSGSERIMDTPPPTAPTRLDPVDPPRPEELVPVVAHHRQAAAAGARHPDGSGSPSGSSRDESVRQPATSPSDPDRQRLAVLQERLRQLGATYYRLELWDPDRQLYHFHCRVPVNGNPHFTRYFEDTDTDPARAMETVAAQIEAWRGGGGSSRAVGLATVPARGVR